MSGALFTIHMNDTQVALEVPSSFLTVLKVDEKNKRICQQTRQSTVWVFLFINQINKSENSKNIKLQNIRIVNKEQRRHGCSSRSLFCRTGMLKVLIKKSIFIFEMTHRLRVQNIIDPILNKEFLFLSAIFLVGLLLYWNGMLIVLFSLSIMQKFNIDSSDVRNDVIVWSHRFGNNLSPWFTGMAQRCTVL